MNNLVKSMYSEELPTTTTNYLGGGALQSRAKLASIQSPAEEHQRDGTLGTGIKRRKANSSFSTGSQELPLGPRISSYSWTKVLVKGTRTNSDKSC